MKKLALVGVLLLIGCTSVTPGVTAPATAPGEATAPAEATPPPGSPPSKSQGTPVVSPTQPAGTTAASPTLSVTTNPHPSPEMTLGRIFLYTSTNSGYTSGEIIQLVKNTGSTWIEVSAFDSTWTVYAADDSITETGSFDIAAGRWLAPGETGYLLGELFSDSGRSRDFDHADADGLFSETEDVPEVLSVEKTKVRNQSFGGVEVVGQVINASSDTFDVTVSAVFLNSKGDPIGIAWTYADNVQPDGGRKSFQAQSDFPNNINAIDKTLYFTEG